jgi:murein DD-endopeptidase MepM/ murein hydrolase activator NlpD
VTPVVQAGPAGAPGATAEATAASAPSAKDAARLKDLAAEFESMLLGQMLRTMRESGSWKDEAEGEGDTFGGGALFETLDAELSRHLSKAQGFGLAGTLMPQLMAMRGIATAGTDAAASASTLPGTRPTALPSTLPTTLPTTAAPGLVSSVPGIAGVGVAEGGGATVSPLDSGRTVTSAFGWRRDPFTGGATYHRGVDLRAAYGEPVSAMAGGRVVFAGAQGGYGNTVVLEHANGVRSRYAHLSSILVDQGGEVAAGDSIGRAGRSGRATGTHLHFEVTQDGRPIDPAQAGMAPLKPERVVADLGVGQEPSGRQGAQ